MKYGMGMHFENPHRKLSYTPAYGNLIYSTPDITTTSLTSLSQYCAPVFDQGATSSCEGHRAAQGIYTAFNAANIGLSFIPSPDGIYKNARCNSRTLLANKILSPLVDEGCMSSDVISTLQVCGIKPMGPHVEGRISDVSSASVNHEPTITDLEQESLFLVTGEYNVDLSDTAMALKTIRACLTQYPIWLDIFCESNFQVWGQSADMNSPPLDICNIHDTQGGGHAILCTSLEVKSDGSIILAGPNSWSAEWGVNGFWRATAEWFKLAVDNAIVARCTRI